MPASIRLFLLTLLLTAASAQAQAPLLWQLTAKDPLIRARSFKSGPYIGAQRGAYWFGEFGAEMQFKKIKLTNPRVHALHTGVQYNFTNNVLGYDLGYWYQGGRLGLTYGATLLFRTDFTHNRLGIAPVVGFKLFQFHLQTGYQLLTPSNSFTAINRFFLSLRFVIINNRDIDIQTRKRDKHKQPLWKRDQK